MHHEGPLLVSVPEAARLLGIGKTMAWDLVYSGELKVVRLGKRVLVPRLEIDRFVAGKAG
jgi:excisionase family DNA binding protein